MHGMETRPDIARKQQGNYCSIVRPITVKFSITYTIFKQVQNELHITLSKITICKFVSKMMATKSLPTHLL